MNANTARIHDLPRGRANDGLCGWVSALALTAMCLFPKAVAAGEGPADYARDIAPILSEKCFTCHGPDAAQRKAGLRLHDGEGAFEVLKSGVVAVAPGNRNASALFQRITAHDSANIMPPPEFPKRLSPEEIELLGRWIDEGAPWGTHWAFEPMRRAPLPAVQDQQWPRNPIDHFVLARLEQEGMRPAPEADAATLVRRLYFDLTGLPPTPEEMEAFLAEQTDQSDPYFGLVDRLLASPRHGERWGRHWLDVAHYADTHGYDKDKRREHAWPYRDYVIRAFNEDKPYGQFVEEQLAGDVLYPESPDGVRALGFIAAGPWDFVGHAELREDTVDKHITRVLDRDDMVSTAMAAFTSLTVGCARCHDHKFDPISQREYYGLQAVFAGVDRADRPYDEDPTLHVRRQALLREQLQLRAGTAPGAAVEARLAEIDAALQALPAPQWVYAAAPDFKGYGSFTPPRGPRAVFVLARGDVKQPLEPATPGGLAAVTGPTPEFSLDASAEEGARRAALARWITHPENTLTWRSLVNRVWHYHFGQGIVDTPNDFGHMGAPPTHPELLDWLALEFLAHGQSLKWLHKTIVTSAAYRQAVVDHPEYAARDGSNKLIWRMNRRQLEVEALRDAMLQASGCLDLSMGGPGVDFFAFEDDHSPRYLYEQHDVDDPASWRRSVYRFIVRSVPDPLMETLDCADPDQSVPVRNTTITALQSLALLNNTFVVNQAQHLAQRVEAEIPERSGQIQRAYQLTLARSPSPEEEALLDAYAAEHGLANACRVLLNSNEFLFVD